VGAHLDHLAVDLDHVDPLSLLDGAVHQRVVTRHERIRVDRLAGLLRQHRGPHLGRQRPDRVGVRLARDAGRWSRGVGLLLGLQPLDHLRDVVILRRLPAALALELLQLGPEHLELARHPSAPAPPLRAAASTARL